MIQLTKTLCEQTPPGLYLLHVLSANVRQDFHKHKTKLLLTKTTEGRDSFALIRVISRKLLSRVIAEERSKMQHVTSV